MSEGSPSLFPVNPPKQRQSTAEEIHFVLWQWCNAMSALNEILREGVDPLVEPVATCRGCGNDVEVVESLRVNGEKLFDRARKRYPWFNPSVLWETQTLLLSAALDGPGPNDLARFVSLYPLAQSEINRLNRACEIDICPECRAEYIAVFGEDISSSSPPKMHGLVPTHWRKKLGRPMDTDPDADRCIAEAWQTGMHESLETLGYALGMTKREVKRALDRHRKRSKD
jgi:hypothetical protein